MRAKAVVQALCIALLGIVLAIPAGAAVMANPGFETGDFTGWTVVEGVWEVTSYGGNIGYEGAYYAWAQALGDPNGNSYTGVLQSDGTFTIDEAFLQFRIAGHDHSGANECRVELVRASDGSVLQTATPPNADRFSTVSWDVSGLMGVQVYIRATDASTSGWVGIDDFVLTSEGTGAIANPDFETGTFDGWSVVQGVWDVTYYPGVPGFHGNFYAWSNAGSNEYTGVLKSNTFTVDANYLRFLVVGWDPSGCVVELVKASDDSVLMTASPPNSDTFSPSEWNVSSLIGVEVYIRATDASTTGWVGIDNFVLTSATSFGTLTGTVTLEGFLGNPDLSFDLSSVGVQIQFIQGGSVVLTKKLLLRSDGVYTAADIPTGTYDVAFKAASWLREIVPGVAVGIGSNPPCDVTLKSGDLDGDNEVTSTDLSVLLVNIGQQGE